MLRDRSMDRARAREVPRGPTMMPHRYGPLHHESLKQSRPDVIRELERKGSSFRYFRDAAHDCDEMHTTIVVRLKETHPFSEKEFGTIERWMLWLHQVARELVMEDRVVVPDQETEEARRNGYLD